MRSPQGWLEPGQTPEFDEFTIVLKGTLRVEHKGGMLDVPARGTAEAGVNVTRVIAPAARSTGVTSVPLVRSTSGYCGIW